MQNSELLRNIVQQSLACLQLSFPGGSSGSTAAAQTSQCAKAANEVSNACMPCSQLWFVSQLPQNRGEKDYWLEVFKPWLSSLG
jgi:hypothetical protein